MLDEKALCSYKKAVSVLKQTGCLSRQTGRLVSSVGHFGSPPGRNLHNTFGHFTRGNDSLRKSPQNTHKNCAEYQNPGSRNSLESGGHFSPPPRASLGPRRALQHAVSDAEVPRFLLAVYDYTNIGIACLLYLKCCLSQCA